MQTSIQLDQTRVTWREIDGEIVAVDIQTAEYLTVNGSGALLWDELARGTTEADLADRLAGTYAISSEEAASDVGAFLASLRSRGLVTASA
jgi:coenzyme PQQ synthesis protein D (PqqD)